ncbi:hypothetical protein [Pseudogulbenkiania sp. MAI-1]|uniref:DUF7673 family protein n=1 Tax=Pseudogulbenkiania sp. MAI-1 TaxID=990370 RepID=UPI00045E93C9|nr:hypothetical protein [Pseudogulbenkiania sp. MAI-1]
MSIIPAKYLEEMKAAKALRQQLQETGVAALQRLLPIAQGDTGQSRIVALLLLGLYNDTRFPFPLTELRGLDDALFEDCMTVLRMDARACQQEVHCYFAHGGQIWEQLAKDWNVRDHRKTDNN